MTLPFKPQILMLLCSAGLLAASGVLYVKSRTPDVPPAPAVAQPAPQPAPQTTPPSTPPVTTPTFTTAQIDQWVAPVALYPDALLSQVLMAATYPANVVQAVQWSQDNPTLEGDAAIQAVINQPWDPSVRSLVAFPSLMALMGENPQWVQNLGDAFLAQPKEVMDSVQKLRALAQQTGALTSTPQQKVTTVPAKSSAAPAVSGNTTVVSTPEPTVIKIESADPQVVYVPSYNPSVVYGSWPTPAYPPVYLPPPPGQQFTNSLVRGFGFSLGIATTYALFSNIDWDDDDDHYHRGYAHNGDNINIDVNNFNRISGGRLATNKDHVVWQHNPAFRNNLPSRDLQRQSASAQLNQIARRNNYRGYDTPAATARRDAAHAQFARSTTPERQAQRDAAKTQFSHSISQQNREAIKARRDNPTPQQQQRREAIKARHDNPTPQQQQQQQREAIRARHDNPVSQQQREARQQRRATALSGNDSRSPSWQAQRQRGEQSRQRLSSQQRNTLREHAADRRELHRH
ncbi:DUF3300 domain-containing protein [Enterobacter sp. ENT03]|uniref:DUF3300 domain-containing protein n=1 Tax=Enterobacter sp. ENT03 TaxID=2854780 RepID=UPI001C497648|nr:DUF3300 domain-containing protein [Enterobacter sp. ENT03]MBV7406470.1 DUF3300 domain-containing protein [Enterobacter sp. ENT03]